MDFSRDPGIVLRCLIFLLPLVICHHAVSQTQAPASTIDLSGTWQFQTDPNDSGLADRWYAKDLPETVKLPGSMTGNGKGDDVGVETKWFGGIVDSAWYTSGKFAKFRQPGNIKIPFWLTPSKHYAGAAWYRKSVNVPESWQGKRIVLALERCHWETMLWIDDHPAGVRNSLATAHEYDVSALANPGRHIVTLRVDNRIKDIDVGRNAHSITDHTQTNWNGVTGAITLKAIAPLCVEDIRVYPDVQSKCARVVAVIANTTGSTQLGTLSLQAGSSDSQLPPLTLPFFAIDSLTTVECLYPMGDRPLLWDEFHPNIYTLKAEVRTSNSALADSRSVTFGMREIRADGTRLAVNGRPIFLRGTLECAVFPKTGYPAMRVEEWARIFAVCKTHGLNHMRFHSWCPPEAAFAAADRAGFYLQVECCAWCTVGDGAPIDAWLYQESDRIVRAYGNHPSFCMMAYGNEPGGDNQAKYLGGFVRYWKQKDPRRVYTSGAGWPIIPESDYLSSMYPRIQVWGDGLNSIINRKAPQTVFDFRDTLAHYDRPMVSHEIGQWCAYPNFSEIPKYTGALRAKNFEIFRETLEGNHMGSLSRDFLMASGKLQALCYKADIEAALRTPGMAGFQLLGLSDFPGQGTALVGVLDAFWEGKGYITPAEFRRFCNTTVPLVRMQKMSFLNNEVFAADVEVAHFGPAPLENLVPRWTISTTGGSRLSSGAFAAQNIPWGNAHAIGKIEVPLDQITKATQLRLTVRIGQFENGWDFWVYPASLPGDISSGIVEASRLDDDLISRLQQGGKVLLITEKGSLKPEKGGNIAIGFSSIFWNTVWTSNQPPHTLGILCDPRHPALAEFPTENHSNWEWWDAMSHAEATVLDDFPPTLVPIVRVIDDWVTNRRLGLIYEGKVGKGKLLVSSIDLKTDAQTRPEARQLLYSLKKYMSSKAFNPRQELDPQLLKDLFKT